MTAKTTKNNKVKRVFLQERDDNGKINLSYFNYPDGIYDVSILDKEGDVISRNNEISKSNGIIKLYRHFEGSNKKSVAQTYKIPLNDLKENVLQFILNNCMDIRRLFIDATPTMHSRVLQKYQMSYSSHTKQWYPADNCVPHNSSRDNSSRDNSSRDNSSRDNSSSDSITSFEDIMQFKEKYMIVKGFMQVGKTKFIISAAVWFMIKNMSSIIVLRNYNGDKDQLTRRVEDYNKRLQKFLGPIFEGKFSVEALSNNNIKPEHLNGRNPKILAVIGHANPLKKINDIIDRYPSISKKFVLFLDEVDFIDSEGTGVQKQLDCLRQHCFCSYGVSATILGSTFARDVEAGNVIILSTPEYYKSVVNYKFVHLEYKSKLVATTNGNVLEDDDNMMSYLDEFSCKSPFYVDLYSSQKECTHPVISLLRVALCHSPNLRLLSYIANGYNFPVMYFQGGHGAGKTTLAIHGLKKSITLMNKCKSRVVKHIILKDEYKTKLKGLYHVFDNASPALVLEWIKNKGGGVSKFPRIMILAGGMAARCQSFGAADFNDCIKNKTLAWHLTEMYLSVSTTMDQPELMQTCGRLSVVARDNIQPVMYATKETCNDLIYAFQTQEELIERARSMSERKNNEQIIGKIMENLPIYREKIVKKRMLAKKMEVKLNLVSEEEDRAAGGWSKGDMYHSSDKSGNHLIPDKLHVSSELCELLDIQKHVYVPVLLDKKEFDRLVKMMSIWSKQYSKMNNFLTSLDPDLTYTHLEMRKLARDAGIKRLSELTISYRKESRGYGQILEILSDKRYRLFKELKTPFLSYF